HLPAAGVDAVLVVDTYHHIDDRIGYFRRLRRALRPPGRVAVVHWHQRPMPGGPGMGHKNAPAQGVRGRKPPGHRPIRRPALLPLPVLPRLQAGGGARPARGVAARPGGEQGGGPGRGPAPARPSTALFAVGFAPPLTDASSPPAV